MKGDMYWCRHGNGLTVCTVQMDRGLGSLTVRKLRARTGMWSAPVRISREDLKGKYQMRGDTVMQDVRRQELLS